MTDLTWNVLVGATDIVDPAAGFWTLVSLSDGDLQWRRETVDSPFVPGRTLINAVPDVQTRQLGIRVKAPSLDLLGIVIGAVMVPLTTSFDYTITIKCNGTTLREWTHCEPADFVMANPGSDGLSKYGLLPGQVQQEYLFTIPSDPDIMN